VRDRPPRELALAHEAQRNLLPAPDKHPREKIIKQ